MEIKAKPKQSSLQSWLDLFRSYLDIFLDAYCVVDISGNVVDFNIAFTELTGESHRKISKIGKLSELIKIDSALPVSPAQQVMATEKSLRLDEVKASTKAYPELNLIIGAVPIFGAGEGVVGALVTFRNVSAEMLLQQKYEERKKESVTDPLTRLFNKGYMEENLQRLIKISIRESKTLTLIMADIDHFKKVNDTHGHLAGDYVLKLVSGNLKNMMRETDLAGRFGGEEFMIILNNCNEEGAKIFTERLRKNIETTLFIFEGNRIPITLSQGTSTLTRTWEEGLNIEQLKADLVSKADSALYEAKTSGRNCVRHFGKNSPKK